MLTSQSPNLSLQRPRVRRRSWRVIQALSLGVVLAAPIVFPLQAAGSSARFTEDESCAAVRTNDSSQDEMAKVFTSTPSSEPSNITGPSQLQVYDPATLELVDTADLDFRPHHLYPIPGRNIAIQAHFGPTSNVEILNMVNNKIVGKIGTGLGPRHLSFNSSNTVAYSANFDGNSISVLDLAELRNVATIPVGKKPNYVQYVETTNGPRLFVENFGENTVTVIDVLTLRTISTVTVGNGPFNASVAENGRTLISANARDNTVTFVDTSTLQVTATVSVGGTHDKSVGDMQRLNPRISPEGKWLWVGNQDASVFSIVNIPERRLQTLLPAGKGADIAFFPADGPAHGLALLTNRYDAFVTVAKLNGDEPPTPFERVPRIQTSALGSHFITFDEDYLRGYVSERPGRAFSVLDMKTLTELANVPVGPGPKTEPATTDPSQAGPDQAFYVWFESGRAYFHDEHASRSLAGGSHQGGCAGYPKGSSNRVPSGGVEAGAGGAAAGNSAVPVSLVGGAMLAAGAVVLARRRVRRQGS